MTIENAGEIVARVRAQAASAANDAQAVAEAGRPDKGRLATAAAEFESMLLVQMLRDMRTSGSWDTEGDGDTLGAETFYETLDVELASHLSKAGGFGLGKQLLGMMDGQASGGSRTAGFAIGAPGLAGGEGAAPSYAVSQSAALASTSAAGLSHVVKASVAAYVGATSAVASAAAAPLTVEPAVLEASLTAPSGTVTSDYGWRNDPLNGAHKFHRGIDLRAAYGQDVHSAGPGRVIFSGEQGGYGTTVVLEHANGVKTRYAHLSDALVRTGEEIGPQQVIGRAGRSGRATGTHLHFEVIAQGKHVDPAVLGLKPERVVADSVSGNTTGLQERTAHDHQD